MISRRKMLSAPNARPCGIIRLVAYPKIVSNTCVSMLSLFCLLKLLQLPVDLLMLLQKQEREHGVGSNTDEARYPALEHPTESFCSHSI
jgi:hypothetical protein